MFLFVQQTYIHDRWMWQNTYQRSFKVAFIQHCPLLVFAGTWIVRQSTHTFTPVSIIYKKRTKMWKKKVSFLGHTVYINSNSHVTVHDVTDNVLVIPLCDHLLFVYGVFLSTLNKQVPVFWPRNDCNIEMIDRRSIIHCDCKCWWAMCGF